MKNKIVSQEEWTKQRLELLQKEKEFTKIQSAKGDVNLIGISNGPLEKLEAFKKRMGWSFNWASALGSDFNYDFQVSVRGDGAPFTYNYRQILGSSGNEWPGISVFYKDEEGVVYHTYSTYARGLEDFNTAYRYLDIVPKGRDEGELAYGMEWVKLRDQY